MAAKAWKSGEEDSDGGWKEVVGRRRRRRDKKDVLPYTEEDFPSLIIKKVKEESPSNEVTGAHNITEEESSSDTTNTEACISRIDKI